MNVYDFDGTIYDGDSSKDFYFFVLKKYPKILKYLLCQLKGIFGYALNCFDKTRANEYFFCFLQGIPKIEECLEEFWNLNENKIMKWYMKQQKEDDIIISASPDFLLRPICKRLGIHSLIASNVNIYTGKFEGPNCYGKEKIVRFRKEYPNNSIDNFYSDSISDIYLKEIAYNGFLVRNNAIEQWTENTNANKFVSIEFLRFVIIGGVNAFNGILFAYIFSLFMQKNIGFICGYIVSLTISYLLNSFITFREELEMKRYIKFCISYIPNFLLQNIIVFIFLNLLKWPTLCVYMIAVGVSVPITYLLVSCFAFDKTKKVYRK